MNKNLYYSYCRQIITLIVGILTLPMIVNYFGIEMYGIIALIISFIGYLENISFGIPSSLRIHIKKIKAKYLQYLILFKSFYLLTFIVINIGLYFFIFISLDKSWIIYLLGNIDSEFEETAVTLFIIYIALTLAKMPFSLFINYFIGVNKIYISEIYQTLTIASNLLILIIVVYLKLNIISYISLNLLIQLFISILSFIHVILLYNKASPNLIKKDRINYKLIINTSYNLFQVGLASTIVWNTDTIIISHFFDEFNVAIYVVAFKLFTYMFLFSTLVNAIIAPIYGNLRRSNNWVEINNILNLILKIMPFIGLLMWSGIALFAKDLIIAWIGDSKMYGDIALYFCLGFYAYILSFVYSYATLATSLSYSNEIKNIGWIEAIVNLFISILLVQLLGISGVALGTAIASLLTGLILLPRILKKNSREKIYIDNYIFIKHLVGYALPSMFLVIMLIINSNSIIYNLIFYILLIVFYYNILINNLSKNEIFLINKIFFRKKNDR